MDESFFQTLRQIQKKERSNASLARVGPDFYKQVHSYINKLKRSVGNDPFSDEHYLLKDSQRIATEICERREHKITDAAVMNIHRSYHLFSKSNPEFDLLDTTPLNLTPEEETLYFSLIDILREHRSKISLDKFGEVKEEDLSMKRQPIANPFDDEEPEEISVSKPVEEPKKSQGHSDAILSKLNEIKNAKIIDDEKHESIEKQIANQKYPKPESKIESTPKEEINLKVESTPKEEITSKHESNNKSGFPDVNQLYNQDEQFIDLDKLDNNYENDYYNQVNFEPDPFEVDNLIKRGKESETTTIIMCNDVGEIMGVDEKVYGPFHSQDVVVLPKLNAKIFLDTNQARLVNL